MKRKSKIIAVASASLALALTSFAQLAGQPPSDQTESTRMASAKNWSSRLNHTVKTSDVIGMTVKNYQNEKLGKVDDLILDVESGRVVEAVLTSGGVLWVGDLWTAVPADALHCEAGEKTLQLDASLDKFKRSPRFEAEEGDTDTQSKNAAKVYGYYGEQPYFAAHSAGIGMAGRNETSHLGSLQPASKLMGATVWNLQHENLGTAKNFILDLPAGRIVAVIISSGGFMGMDGELSAVPATALRFNPTHEALQLDASKDMLAGSPHFKANEWPDFSRPDYTVSVYNAYNVRPYFNTNMPDADNTGRNVRDRDRHTLTPLDQGNSQADVDVTAQIRREIIADEGMSMNAKNVKIITVNGRVTLRGPVKTAVEKARIDEIASRVAHAGNVDNQLDVPAVSGN